LAVALFKWAVEESPMPALTALMFVIALLPVAPHIIPVALMAATTVVMAAMVVWEIGSNRVPTADSGAIS
jgi:hypothetical protein